MYPVSVTNFLHTAMLMLQIGLQKKLPQNVNYFLKGDSPDLCLRWTSAV